MKLELEFATEQPPVSYEFTIGSRFADYSEMLDAGVKMAKDGSRAQARQLFLRVAHAEPENETAWLWLASISDYPEELLVFLQNVLNVNPHSERALEWKQATESMLADTFIERGVRALQENRKTYATQCFMQALTHDERNEAAWLALADGADAPEEKAAHLQKLLLVNPNSETALAMMLSLKREISQTLLKKANFAAIAGEREDARRFLAEAMQNDDVEREEAWILKAYLADESQEKIECYEKILDLNPENETAHAGLSSLKALMQKSADQKSNAEILQAAETSVEDSPSSQLFQESSIDNSDSQPEQSPSTVETFDEQTATSENVGSAAQILARDFRFGETSSEGSKNPTDDLNADFVDEIKSSGGLQETQENEHDDETESENRVLVEAETENFDDLLSVAKSQPLGDAEDFSFETISYFNGDDEYGDAAQFSEDLASESEAFELPPIDTSSETSELDFAALEFPDVPEYQAHPVESPQSNDNRSIENGEQHEENSPAIKTETDAKQLFTADSDNVSESLTLDRGLSSGHEFSSNHEFAPTVAHADIFERNEEISAPADYATRSPERENSIHKSFAPNAEPFACPFCYAPNEPQAFVCLSCCAWLSLSDLEMLLSHQGAHPEILEMAIKLLESERTARPLDETELTNLAVAHLNAKNLRAGLVCLQEAAQLAPNNIVLAAQVNFLAIRLSEIEAQESRVLAAGAPKNLTIMIVDNSPMVRRLVSGKLEKCGHAVVAAVDGAEALTKIGEVVPDLILLDIALPQMDGYQVCKLIRGNQATRDVPVVMISGKEGFFDQERGRTAGTTGYITKPFGPETLMRTIETYVV